MDVNENQQDELNSETQSAGNWSPLSPMQRRVAGVLVEKSKTTPDVYPMTINSVKNASNQKSNRSPQMDLREDQVETVLDELRELGAAIEVYTGGRVQKYKHELYEWLGVERIELAVMAELLLRGEQTLGDLRARATRMDKISSQSELKPVVENLIRKNLVIELTPVGRGQIVTHNLYQQNELERLRRDYGGFVAAPGKPNVSSTETDQSSEQSPKIAEKDGRIDQLESEVSLLKRAVSELQQQVSDIGEMLK